MDKLKKKRLYLLDMDGTIYLGDRIFDGTLEFLDYIKQIGGKYMFLTNNSSKSVERYVEKVNKMGIKATTDDFFTSTNATVIYLKQKLRKKIYALGTKAFKEQLIAANLNICDTLQSDIDCLCMGFDTELTFSKLEDACKLLKNDIEYIATNPDWVCPTEYGYVPDCGSVSEMLFKATGKRPYFIGKPKPDMINLAIKESGFSKEEAVIIGDRLYTDIASGINAGISTVFVLSGEGTLDDIKTMDIHPEYIFENVLTLYKDLIC